jgi:AraC-like DNA-binding protein
LPDRDLIEAFMAMHCAIEEGRDVFMNAELLIGSFGRLFERHGSGADRIRPRRATGSCWRRRSTHAGGIRAELRLEDLAAEVGLTTFQLIGLFKRTVGLTPHAYLTQVRLGMACRPCGIAGAGRGRDGGRLLRPERAQQALQALLRHHAAAVRPRRRGSRLSNFRQYRSTDSAYQAGNAPLLP